MRNKENKEEGRDVRELGGAALLLYTNGWLRSVGSKLIQRIGIKRRQQVECVVRCCDES
jgi:hypothetical protein